MCIFLIYPQNETKRNILEKKAFELINEQIPKIADNIKKSRSSFSHYSTFQFVWIDFEFHQKFQRNLKVVQEKNEDFIFEDLKAFGLMSNNKKITYLTNLVNFEDWILDLIETPENQHYIYISETFKEDLTHYLKNVTDSFLKVRHNKKIIIFFLYLNNRNNF